MNMHIDAAGQQKLPITILTGFLGSGKTTLLNYILTERHGHRIAVIENEYGEVDVDSDLVLASDEEIFQMQNGCICCFVDVRNDLIDVMKKLLSHKDKFDHIIVETSGLADPTPVATAFFVDRNVADEVELDAVVTLVDAKFFLDRLGDAPEAEDQVAFADVILLNKTDLVGADELAEVEATLHQLNPYAKVYKTTRSAVDLDKILDRGAFDLDRVLELDPSFLDADQHDHDHVCGPDCDHDHHHHDHDHDHHHHGHETHHDTEITSVSLRGGELDPDKILTWISEVTQTQGPDILRLKGILAFPDEPLRYVVQGVHMIVEGDLQRAWKDGEARESRLVFIGRHLDKAALEAGFKSCAA